jgi:hypothetical protein
MTTMNEVRAGSAPGVIGADLKRTARTTGLLYLGFFITGILGSMVVRAQLFVAADPQRSLSNLTQQEPLARIDIALELSIVLAQALAAVWFYRLFRSVNGLAAGSLMAFGMVNAVAILGSAALLLRPMADPDGLARAALSVGSTAAGTNPDRGRRVLSRQRLRDLPIPRWRTHRSVADRPGDHW